MALRLLSIVIKISLSALDITAAQVLQELGLTPERIMNLLHRAFNWALPHIILGALIIVPIWFVMYLLRPPRGD